MKKESFWIFGKVSTARNGPIPVKFQGTIKEIGLQQGTVLHPVKFQETKKEIGLQ